MSGLAPKADVLSRMALELIPDEGFGVSRNVVSDNVYRSNYIPATKTLVAERWTAHDLRNGTFSTCVRSTTSIVFTRAGAEVDMSCSIFFAPRHDRWSAKPRLGLVLNIAIRFRDLAPLGLPNLAAVVSLLPVSRDMDLSPGAWHRTGDVVAMRGRR